MKKQIFFLHSGGPQGSHEGSSDFITWLKKELGTGYEIMHPIMPHPDSPDYESWREKLNTELPKLNDEAIFVGHSLGGSILLKYLAEESFDRSVAGLFLVSVPFWGGDENWDHDEFKLHDRFIETLPEMSQIFLYHSKSDPVVPFAHQALYAKALPKSIVREIDGKEHAFARGLPELVEDIQSLEVK